MNTNNNAWRYIQIHFKKLFCDLNWEVRVRLSLSEQKFILLFHINIMQNRFLETDLGFKWT